MAADTKTTAERMNILINCSNTLRQCAKLCSDVQKYADTCTDYINRADNVNARMATIQEMIRNISNELSELASDENMAFQYEWVVGRGDITEIYVDSATNTVALRRDPNAFVTSAFHNALSAGDRVKFENAQYNNTIYNVASVAPGASVAYLSGLHGTESLLSRVIKALAD